MFVWNKKNSCKPWNLYQSDSTVANKQALLIYDTHGLMVWQWIVALLWLIFIKLLLSLMSSQYMTDKLDALIALELLCMSVFLCAGVWQSSRCEDHLKICYIAQGTWQRHFYRSAWWSLGWKTKGRNGEYIVMYCLCICLQSLAEMLFLTFKAFTTGNLNA